MPKRLNEIIVLKNVGCQANSEVIFCKFFCSLNISKDDSFLLSNIFKEIRILAFFRTF